MREIYFENITGIGNLYLEKVFNRFEDENIIFICNDDNEKRYLCICYEFRKALKWIVTEITLNNIIRLISKKVDIRSIYEFNAERIVHIKYEAEAMDSFCTSMKNLENNIFPKEGVFLKTDSKINAYFHRLCSDLVEIKEYSCEKLIPYILDTKQRFVNKGSCYEAVFYISYDLNPKRENNRECSFISLDEAA